MALSTYAELLTAVDTFAVRGDQASVAADYVTLGEARINRLLRCRRMVTRATATLDEEYEGLPSDFLGMVGVKLTDVTPKAKLEYLPPDGMDDLDASGPTSGQPAYYSIVGSELRVLPAPADSYTAELAYFAQIPALSDANPTNWLLTAAPDIYLYAALYAFGLRTEDERAPAWLQMFQQAVAELQQSELNDAQGETLAPRVAYAP